MSKKVSDIIIANDEFSVKLLDIPEITLGITVTEAFYGALRSLTPDCALMLIKHGAVPDLTKMIDMMLEIKCNEIHIIKNMLACSKIFIDYCNHVDERAILCQFIRKLSPDNTKYNSIVGFLIEIGIDINKKDRRGKTPLRLLCARNEIGLINILICKNVDLNKKSASGHTALTYSIFSKKKACALLLINSGADLDSQLDDGDTALMLAVELYMREIVVVLINNGANTSIINNKFHTALDIAKDYYDSNDNIVRILRTHSSVNGILVDGSIKFESTCSMICMLIVTGMMLNIMAIIKCLIN
jgi:hypothetical protein